MARRSENKKQFETDAQAQADGYVEMNINRNSVRVWTKLISLRTTPSDKTSH
jgi:hypothetical protein